MLYCFLEATIPNVGVKGILQDLNIYDKDLNVNNSCQYAKEYVTAIANSFSK